MTFDQLFAILYAVWGDVPEQLNMMEDGRMKTLLFVVFLVSVLALPVFAYDWVTSPANGHRYILVDAESWTGAESQAVALGGHLATIRNDAENDWIYQFALANKADCYRLWIGIHINSPNESGLGWEWVSNEQVSYTYWNNLGWFDPDYPGWSNHNRGGFMWVRYWDVQDEQLKHWGPEVEEGLPGNPVYKTGIVEVVPEPSSLLALSSLIAPLVLMRRKRG